MYLTHWGLREAPFEPTLDPRGFYEGPMHEEALARLNYVVSGRRRLGVLLGSRGVGKSLVLEVLAAELRRTGHRAHRQSLAEREAGEFLSALAVAWGLNPEVSAARAVLWRMLEDRLAEFRYLGTPLVLLADDADRAAPSALAEMARLLQTTRDTNAALAVIVAAHRDGVSHLGERLLELADLRIDLEPWDADQTRGYVLHALERAGRTKPLFDAAALERLHELTRGVPRQVNQLAELALLAGAGQELATIDADTVEQSCRELGMVGDEGGRSADVYVRR